MTESNGSTLWTVSCDCGATGEGRTIMALVGYATDAADALKQFATVFDEYFALSATVEQGVVANASTRLLFSRKTLGAVRDMEGRANVRIHAALHFNYI